MPSAGGTREIRLRSRRAVARERRAHHRVVEESFSENSRARGWEETMTRFTRVYEHTVRCTRVYAVTTAKWIIRRGAGARVCVCVCTSVNFSHWPKWFFRVTYPVFDYYFMSPPPTESMMFTSEIAIKTQYTVCVCVDEYYYYTTSVCYTKRINCE